MSAKSKHMISKGLLKIAQQWQGDNLEGGMEREREREHKKCISSDILTLQKLKKKD